MYTQSGRGSSNEGRLEQLPLQCSARNYCSEAADISLSSHRFATDSHLPFLQAGACHAKVERGSYQPYGQTAASSARRTMGFNDVIGFASGISNRSDTGHQWVQLREPRCREFSRNYSAVLAGLRWTPRHAQLRQGQRRQTVIDLSPKRSLRCCEQGPYHMAL